MVAFNDTIVKGRCRSGGVGSSEMGVREEQTVAPASAPEYSPTPTFQELTWKENPGNEFPGSSTEVPSGLHGQSESLRGLQYFSLIFQCQAVLFLAIFLPQLRFTREFIPGLKYRSPFGTAWAVRSFERTSIF